MSKITLTVNNKKCIQEHFYGANAVYHYYATAQDFPERRYNPEQIENEFERIHKMGLKIARTYFDYCAYKNGVWDWENEEMQSLYKWLDAMKKRNISVMLGACWWITSVYFGNENSPFFDENPYISAEKYGKWVSELVYNVIIKRGFTNVKYLVLFTEPNDGTVKLCEKFPELEKFEPYGMAVRAAHNCLIKDQRRHLVKLVGPNEAANGLAYAGLLKYCSENLSDCIDVFSAHTYCLKESVYPKETRETYNGEWSVAFSVPGYRLQQEVVFEPNVEYEFSFYAKLTADVAPEEWGRGIYYGAFYGHSGPYNLITAGNMGLSSLTEDSVKYFSAEKISKDWKQYKIRFNSKDNSTGFIGVFHDVLNEDVTIFYDEFSLKRVNDNSELLKNSNLENGNDGNWLIFPSQCCLGENKSEFKEYNFWYKLAKEFISVIPQNKEFCFDEYNNLFHDLYTDSVHGTTLACAQCALINAGVNNSLLWTAIDQFWPNCNWDGYDFFVNGEHRWGLMPVLSRSLTPYPSYYAFTLLSRYLGDGDSIVYEGDNDENGTCVSYLEGRDGSKVLLVVNGNLHSEKIDVVFKETINTRLNRHLYDSSRINPNEKAEIIPIDKTMEISDVLSDIIPANSFAIYTTRED